AADHAADASAHPCQAAIQLPSPLGELAVETQRAQLPAGFPQGVQAATGGEGSRRYSGGGCSFCCNASRSAITASSASWSWPWRFIRSSILSVCFSFDNSPSNNSQIAVRCSTLFLA